MIRQNSMVQSQFNSLLLNIDNGLTNFKEIGLNKNYADIVLFFNEDDNTEHLYHKLILSNYSSYFKSLFESLIKTQTKSKTSPRHLNSKNKTSLLNTNQINTNQINHNDINSHCDFNGVKQSHSVISSNNNNNSNNSNNKKTQNLDIPLGLLKNFENNSELKQSPKSSPRSSPKSSPRSSPKSKHKSHKFSPRKNKICTYTLNLNFDMDELDNTNLDILLLSLYGIRYFDLTINNMQHLMNYFEMIVQLKLQPYLDQIHHLIRILGSYLIDDLESLVNYLRSSLPLLIKTDYNYITSYIQGYIISRNVLPIKLIKLLHPDELDDLFYYLQNGLPQNIMKKYEIFGDGDYDYNLDDDISKFIENPYINDDSKTNTKWNMFSFSEWLTINSLKI
jgi:hypothetical protein